MHCATGYFAPQGGSEAGGSGERVIGVASSKITRQFPKIPGSTGNRVILAKRKPVPYYRRMPLPQSLLNNNVYMVGIKGTGMTALAEVLLQRGARVSGSDVPEVFYTDAILKDLGIPVFEGFEARNVPSDSDLVVYSAAYDPAKHPELLAAAAAGIPMLAYHQALGEVSAELDSSAVSGVHGKTSTSAMAGVLVQGLGLRGSVLVGSGVANFKGHAVYSGGNTFFVAETCEYRRHFQSFHPRRIILTGIEPDHLDYFRDMEDITSAFVDFALKLPEGGVLIYCADDPGAVEAVSRIAIKRHDIIQIPYGFTAEGDFRITKLEQGAGFQRFELAVFRNAEHSPGEAIAVNLRVPGTHMVRNATAAMALLLSIYADFYGDFSRVLLSDAAKLLGEFRGTKRRSELVAEVRGIRILDDYGHHPSAIRLTLEGYRAFYPGSRIVLSFMSHTYSRTAALLDEFAASFAGADIVFLHDIYASAREEQIPGISGEVLAQRARQHHSDVRFVRSFDEAATNVAETLKPGDLFVTMGAGNNWQVGQMVLAKLREAGNT